LTNLSIEVQKAIKFPYSFTGLKGLLQGIEDVIPGAQILAIAQLIYEVWNTYNTISRQIDDLIAAIKVLQSVRDCTKYGTAAQTGPLKVAFYFSKKRDTSPASFPLDFNQPELVAFVNRLNVPITGGPEVDMGRLGVVPHGFCPINDPAGAPLGTRCLCDITPSTTMSATSPCAEMWDWLPENKEGGISHANAVCHPVNCRPSVPNAHVLKFRIDAPFSAISDNALLQFEQQIMKKAHAIYGGDMYLFSITSLGPDPADASATIVTVEVTDSLRQPVNELPQSVHSVAHDVSIQFPSRPAAGAALVSDSPSPFIIAAYVVGALIFVAIVATVAVILVRRHRLQLAAAEEASLYHEMTIES